MRQQAAQRVLTPAPPKKIIGGTRVAEGTLKTFAELKAIRVTGGVLVELLSYSAIQNISRLVKLGVLPTSDGRGAYPLAALVQAYVRHIRNQAYGKDTSVTSDKNRHLAAKADIEELKAKALTGELVPIKEVIGVYERSFSMVRSRALALPSKIAAKLGMCQNAVEAQELLRSEIEELLNDSEIGQVDFKGRAAKILGHGLSNAGLTGTDPDLDDADDFEEE